MAGMKLPEIRQRDLKTYQIVKTSTEHVCKSTYEPTGSYVFIKLLSLVDRSERERQEILREVEYIGRIKAEHLTETVGIYRTQVTIGIVTEWMPNESLHSLIHQHDLYPVLPLSICIRILTDIAEGLTYLHNLYPPVIHQRLKPCNILLDSQYRAKLSDFWLSEMQKVSVSLDQNNNASTEYLSPDRLQKHGPTTADDIYSLGILLHETLSRKQPFHESNPLKLETKIIRGVRPQPSIDVILKLTDLPHSQRASLSQLANLCWHMNPSLRPTAAECLSRLRTIQQVFPNKETEREIQALIEEKERASQHSQIRAVEFDIKFLDECWSSNSHRNRTQSAPEETTEETAHCNGKKEQRSASLPVSSLKTNTDIRVPCRKNTAKNFGVRWAYGRPVEQAASPCLAYSKNYAETLDKNREIILNRMTEGHLNYLIDTMRSKSVLSRDDSENINAEKTLMGKIRKCLDTCSEKGEEASKMTLDILRSRNVIFMHPKSPV